MSRLPGLSTKLKQTHTNEVKLLLTVRLHMGVIFDPTVRYAAIASVLFDILLSALMTL